MDPGALNLLQQAAAAPEQDPQAGGGGVARNPYAIAPGSPQPLGVPPIPGTGISPVPGPLDDAPEDIGELDPLEEPEINMIPEEPYGSMDPSPVDGPKTAIDRCPEVLKDKGKRDTLGMRLQMAASNSDLQKGDLLERIKRNEAFYENKNLAPAKLPWLGAQFFHIGMTYPRIQKRKSAFVNTVCSQERVFRMLDLGRQDRVEAVEQTLDWHLSLTNFKYRLDEMAQIAYVTNGAHWRVTFQHHPEGYEGSTITGPFAGIVLDPIHPEYMDIWPAGGNGIAGARYVGHKWEELQSDVQARQESGEWFNDNKVLGGDKRLRDRPEDLQNPQAQGGAIEDANVVLRDGIWREDLDGDGIAERYHVIWHEPSAYILEIEEYKIPFAHYVAMNLKRETGLHWTEGSVAQDMQGLQVLMNSLMNLFVWGVQMSTMPPVLTEGGTSGDSLKGYRPGTLQNVRNVKATQPLQINFQAAQMFPMILNIIKDFADSVSNVSGALTGSPSTPTEQTATAENIKYQGFQLSGSDDVNAMQQGLTQVARISLWLLAENFDVWYQMYKDQVSVESADELRRNLIIELASTDPQDAPQLQIQQAQLLLQLATTFPQAQLPIVEILRTIVNATNLKDKGDILRAIDQNAAALQQLQAQYAEQGIGQNGQNEPNGPGQPPHPGGPPALGAGRHPAIGGGPPQPSFTNPNPALAKPLAGTANGRPHGLSQG
jgi:hypothetical protein